MRNLRRLAWAAVAAAATGSPAAAQQGGGGGGGGGAGGNTGGNTGGNLGNFQTNPGGAAQTQSTAGTTSGTNGGTTGTSTIPQLVTVERAPPLVAPSTYATGSGGGAVQSSNFLAPSFANPLEFGILKNTRTGTFTPTGFGNPTFGTATGARGGAAAGVTATTGRAGATAGGLTTDPGGQLVALPRQIAYTAQLKFAPQPLLAPQLQADLRGVIDRAGLTAGATAVDVRVDGNAVVLRGAVRDGDEARLVEGLVRLTPGVGRITNELIYPR